MIVVPVIDLQAQAVVRGVAGRRSEYRPLVSQLVSTVTPATLAQVFADEFGFRTVYVADLDAIAGNAPNYAAYRDIAARGLTIWLDAGISNAQHAQRLMLNCAQEGIDPYLIVGLETLCLDTELVSLVQCIGPDRAIFSLDMKSGQPLTSIPVWQHVLPQTIAIDVLEAGFRRMILLDLANVGLANGPGMLPFFLWLRGRDPKLKIIGGGGIRDKSDLMILKTLGVSAALVATALHDGTLTADDLRDFGD